MSQTDVYSERRASLIESLLTVWRHTPQGVVERFTETLDDDAVYELFLYANSGDVWLRAGRLEGPGARAFQLGFVHAAYSASRGVW